NKSAADIKSPRKEDWNCFHWTSARKLRKNPKRNKAFSSLFSAECAKRRDDLPPPPAGFCLGRFRRGSLSLLDQELAASEIERNAELVIAQVTIRRVFGQHFDQRLTCRFRDVGH